MEKIKITECPRDAMQGLSDFIPTDVKINYENQLLKCGFDVLDFGSFVSPKYIPQWRDTAAVLEGLDLSSTKTKLLSIVANERGAEDALNFEEISYLGYPFSVSETFQKRNTNIDIEGSWDRISAIANKAAQKNRSVLVYLSMGFGNPYGDPWNAEIVLKWASRLYTELGVKILALSDTIGAATPELAAAVFKEIAPELPHVEFGAHMHVRPQDATKMIESVYNAGCRRFDGAINGFGGCPMAEDVLVGNMPTETMIDWMESNGMNLDINDDEFKKALKLSTNVFPLH